MVNDVLVGRSTPTAEGVCVRVGGRPLTIAALLAVAEGRARILLDDDPELRARRARSVRLVHEQMSEGRSIYGVTTGVGDSCLNGVSPGFSQSFSTNLVRLHGCGTGNLFSDIEAAAAMVARLACLARGHSGVREVVLDRLCDLLNGNAIPLIPSEGSVGASGDLTPLSYVAAALSGERQVWWKGQVVDATSALRDLGREALALGPKEALALMNGTSVMTGLACLAFERAVRLARTASAVTAMLVDVLRSNRAHFDARIFAAKPHPGSVACARWIREDIELGGHEPVHAGRLQDRYSIRCAPHVIGVLLDLLASAQVTIEIELNGVNDNPIIDPESGDILHGGNFYGGHIAHAMDSLKSAVASVADLLDRQMAMLCNPLMNNGLPADLVARTGADRTIHHGFKAVQIATSALAAEALKLTMPAASFSRSTESHNQDKVSMGTIAARDALRVLELTETIAMFSVLAACQAVDLRGGEGCHRRSLALHQAVRAMVPVNDADRAQSPDLHRLLAQYRARALPIGEIDLP
jgi:histidine ammonia-lyase